MSCGINHVEKMIMCILFHISTMYQIYLSICMQASEYDKMLRNRTEAKSYGDYFLIYAFFFFNFPNSPLLARITFLKKHTTHTHKHTHRPLKIYISPF